MSLTLLDGWENLPERERVVGVRAGDPIFVAPDYWVDGLLDRYGQSRIFRTYTPETRRNYATDIALLLTFLWSRGRVWAEATGRDLEDYEHWRRFAESNPERIGGAKWNRELAAFMSLFTWAVAERIVAGNPVAMRQVKGRNGGVLSVAHARAKDARPSNVQWLTPRTWRRWIDVGLRGHTREGVPQPGWVGRVEDRNVAFVRLMTSSGLRRSEGGSLLTFEVPKRYLDGGRYYRGKIAAEVTRSKKPRTFYVASDAVADVETYVDSSRAWAVRKAQKAGRYDVLPEMRIVTEVTGGRDPVVHWRDQDGVAGRLTLNVRDGAFRAAQFRPLHARSPQPSDGSEVRTDAGGSAGLSPALRGPVVMVQNLLGHASRETTVEIYLAPVADLQLRSMLAGSESPVDAPLPELDSVFARIARESEDRTSMTVSSWPIAVLRERPRTQSVPWVAIAPVANAIRVLERIVPDGHLLFDHDSPGVHGRRSDTGSLKKHVISARIEGFIAWANTEAANHHLTGVTIPPDLHGRIGTARFRRTLAWHIARRPGGLVALAVQYGHLRTSLVSAGYASRSRGGIHELLDIETVRAVADTVTELQEDLDAGAGVSGPAARRAIKAATHAPRFAGTTITATTARRLLANEDAMIYDNPQALLLCHYKRDQVLCHRDGVKDTPSLDQCVPACGNIVRTEVNSASQCLHRRLVPWTRTDHTLSATATMPGDNRSRSSTRTAAFAAPDRPGTSRYRTQGLLQPRSRSRSEAGVLRGTAPSDASHGRHPPTAQDRPDRT
ncbi:hypothetical protein ACTMTU_35345 [Streptomyces sp. OZ13]|uniref:hypothetical protein n=1 Tax=Streptomyces sp. OZ13 TaxID=3452210 RepID=UPI003F8CB2F5